VSSNIHPTARIAPGAQIGEGVTIGPYCLIGESVRLEAGCRLEGHVVIEGRTWLGADCRVFPFAVLGTPPQDLKYEGEDSALEIGPQTTIREHATLHTGTRGGGGVTRLGADGLVMIGAHVAHDCQLGDRVVLANNATLAGHVEVGDDAVIGGLSAVVQFTRIGRGAMIGGFSGVEADVIPYGLVQGERARLAGLNLVGLKRQGLDRARIARLRRAYDRLFDAEPGGAQSQATLAARARALAEAEPDSPEIAELARFIREERGRRGIGRPAAPGSGARVY